MVTVTIVLFLIHYFRSKSIKMFKEDNYVLVEKIDDFEIREYKSTVRASVILKKELKKRINKGFQILFSYIDGINFNNRKIKMVPPVVLELLDGTCKMSFIMPQQYKYEKLPKPKNKRIILENRKAKLYLCYKFSGFATSSIISQKKLILKKYLSGKGIQTLGPYEYHNYNAPYTIFNRHNEIVVPISPLN